MPGWRMTLSRVRLVTALVLCLSVLSIAAAAPLHGHGSASADACAVCQFSYAQVIADTSGPELQPPDVSSCDFVLVDIAAPDPVETGPARGRAPPAH
jgi:hypothetical protein